MIDGYLNNTESASDYSFRIVNHRIVHNDQQ
jgi:hypothetical protein